MLQTSDQALTETNKCDTSSDHKRLRVIFKPNVNVLNERREKHVRGDVQSPFVRYPALMGTLWQSKMANGT